MSSDRQFYCHRCNRNVEMDLANWKCQTCSSGFVEEVAQAPEAPSARTLPNMTRIRVGLNQRGPVIQIGNQSTIGERPEGLSLFDGEGLPEDQRTGMQQMIQNFLYLGGFHFGQGGINPADFAWGPNGLEDIITQLLQQVEGGAPPTPLNAMAQLRPVLFSDVHQTKTSQCSVCLSDFELDTSEIIQLPVCQHIFHPECITNWLNLHNSCPICRTGLTENGQNRNPTSGHPRFSFPH